MAPQKGACGHFRLLGASQKTRLIGFPYRNLPNHQLSYFPFDDQLMSKSHVGAGRCLYDEGLDHCTTLHRSLDNCLSRDDGPHNCLSHYDGPRSCLSHYGDESRS